MYHSRGRSSTEKIDNKSFYVYIHDYPYTNKPFCWLLAGYIQVIVEMSGYKCPAPMKEVECVLNGAKYYKYLISILWNAVEGLVKAV